MRRVSLRNAIRMETGPFSAPSSTAGAAPSQEEETRILKGAHFAFGSFGKGGGLVVDVARDSDRQERLSRRASKLGKWTSCIPATTTVREGFDSD